MINAIKNETTIDFLSGGKQTFWEGGLRVPAIARWPGTILPGQTSSTVWSLMDLFPTILDIANAQQPTDRIIDGKVITDVILGKSKEQVHEVIHFYLNEHLMAARFKQYKIYFYRFTGVELETIKERCKDGASPGEVIILDRSIHSRIKPIKPPIIFDVNLDPSEYHPLPGNITNEIFEEYTPQSLKTRKAI